MAQTASAQTLTLMWDYNSEPEVNGYLVYVGTQSGVYSQTIDVQNTNQYVFSNAQPGQRYYFAVAAYAGSLVSPLSAEVSGTTNDFPEVVYPGNQTGRVGQAVSLQMNGSDPDGTALVWSATGLPPGLTIHSSHGTIAGTPTTAGTYNVTVTASDGVLAGQQAFTWTIQPPANTPPTLANPGTMSSTVGQVILVQLQGSDSDGDALTYSATGLPVGLQLNANTGSISGAPTTAGSYTVNASVTDGKASANVSFGWTVSAAPPQNAAPVLNAPGNQSGTVGVPTSLQLQGSDSNGDALTYSAAGLPPGLQITAGTGLIAGTPTTAGTYNVTASVTDGQLSAQRAFIWTIAAANVAPVLNAPGNQSGTVGVPTSLQLQGSDANGDRLTYSATALPPGLQITAGTGLIAGTPTTAGTYNVTASVTDGQLVAQRTFTWTIAAANVAPVLLPPGNQSGTVGVAAALQLQASDANGDKLTYSASGLPAGLSINANTGRIAGTPTAAGTYNVAASVSDGKSSAQRSFTWTIAAPNAAPVLNAPGNQSGTVGVAAELQLQASDANGDALTYSAAGLPPGLSITVGSGRIAGIPTTAGTYTVTASVSDGKLVAQRSFTWTIAAATGAVDREITDEGAKTTRGANRKASDGSKKGSASTKPAKQDEPKGSRKNKTTTASGTTATSNSTTTSTSTDAYTGTAAITRSIASSVEPEDYTGTAAIARPKGSTADGAINTSLGAFRSVARDAEPSTTQKLTTTTAPVETHEAQDVPHVTAMPKGAVTAPTAAPVVKIESPVENAAFEAGAMVVFSGFAKDAEDGDLTARIVWRSSIDGHLGTGGLVTKALKTGVHVVTASVTDASGTTSKAQVTVVVK